MIVRDRFGRQAASAAQIAGNPLETERIYATSRDVTQSRYGAWLSQERRPRCRGRSDTQAGEDHRCEECSVLLRAFRDDRDLTRHASQRYAVCAISRRKMAVT